MALNLGCIVEGHGDVKAVPVLLRRIRRELVPELELRILRPWRVGRNKLIKAGELELAVERLARQLATPRAILILTDADDDCPAELGPNLLHRAQGVRSDVPIGVVLAKYEFEAWFLAAIESLGGQCGLAEELPAVVDPETIRDAKGFLTRHIEGSRAYSATVDQPTLTATFDTELARSRSDSFDKCWREIKRLLAEAAQEGLRKGRQSG